MKYRFLILPTALFLGSCVTPSHWRYTAKHTADGLPGDYCWSQTRRDFSGERCRNEEVQPILEACVAELSNLQPSFWEDENREVFEGCMRRKGWFLSATFYFE